MHKLTFPQAIFFSTTATPVLSSDFINLKSLVTLVLSASLTCHLIPAFMAISLDFYLFICFFLQKDIQNSERIYSILYEAVHCSVYPPLSSVAAIICSTVTFIAFSLLLFTSFPGDRV